MLKQGGPRPFIKRVSFQEHPLELYTIGWMSYLTRLAQVTLRLWQRLGILPPPLFSPKGALRWYSAVELQRYSALINSHYASGSRDKLALKRALASESVVIRAAFKRIRPETKSPILDPLPNAEKIVGAFESLRTETEVRKTLTKLGYEIDSIKNSESQRKRSSGDDESDVSPKSKLPVGTNQRRRNAHR